jgi:hypothetical protein
MKKLLIVLAIAAAGYAFYRKLGAGAEDRSIWSEVTDPVA